MTSMLLSRSSWRLYHGTALQGFMNLYYMYDFQNTYIARSHGKLVNSHNWTTCPAKLHIDRLPAAKQTIRMRDTFQEVAKACIGWHDHVGCYAKKNNKKKFKPFETLEIYGFLEICESFEIVASLGLVNLSNRVSDSLHHFKDSSRCRHRNKIYPTLIKNESHNGINETIKTVFD